MLEYKHIHYRAAGLLGGDFPARKPALIGVPQPIPWVNVFPTRFPLSIQDLLHACALKSCCTPHNVSPAAEIILNVPSKQVAVGPLPY